MQHARWTFAIAGILLGALDTFLALAAGLTFDVNGRDATLAVLIFLSSSFGVFGFLLGYLVELRRRERDSAALIREQIETLATTRERLAQNEKLASLGQLASAIAHELRNPLAIIRSTVQNLEEDLADHAASAEARESCGFVIDEIDRLSRVTSTLLSFARPLRLTPQAVSVEELFDRIELLSERLLESRQVRLERPPPTPSGAAGLPPLTADADLACQVILGLLDNAAAVTPAGGAVTLEAQPAGEGVDIAVVDGGPGVPRELEQRIFEPFFTTRDEGTGLGLAVARQIAEAHGGSLAVGTGPRGGARFTLHLPALRAAA